MRSTQWLLAALALVVTAAPASAQDAVTIQADQETSIKDFLDQMAEYTGQPMLYDPNGQRIRGQKMGASFKLKVPKQRVFDAFRAILAFYELTLVPVGPKGYQVYLVVDSRSTNNFVKNKATFVSVKDLERYADKDGVYISCAIPVRHIENLTTLRTALSTMVSPAGIGRVHEVPGSRSIIVMDFAPNVAAMARLIRQMDVEPEGATTVLEVIELKHASAEALAATLMDLLKEPERKLPASTRGRTVMYARTPPPLPRIVPYEPRNALVVSATEADFKRIQPLVSRLDLPEKRMGLIEPAPPSRR